MYLIKLVGKSILLASLWSFQTKTQKMLPLSMNCCLLKLKFSCVLVFNGEHMESLNSEFLQISFLSPFYSVPPQALPHFHMHMNLGNFVLNLYLVTRSYQ